jgi:hypothetical protein
MARGYKTGGRQKGTPNKRTKELEDAVKNVAAALGQTEMKWTDGQPTRSWLRPITMRICRCIFALTRPRMPLFRAAGQERKHHHR